jgi:antitoxin (DNA-binding transcriptional repressor) of toxin-antitoxin stability system
MFSVHFTKTNLSKLLQQVEDGKNIVIARGKKPIARMVPCHQLPNSKRPEVGVTTSPLLKIIDKREVAGRVGDTVVYF